VYAQLELSDEPYTLARNWALGFLLVNSFNPPVAGTYAATSETEELMNLQVVEVERETPLKTKLFVSEMLATNIMKFLKSFEFVWYGIANLIAPR